MRQQSDFAVNSRDENAVIQRTAWLQRATKVNPVFAWQGNWSYVPTIGRELACEGWSDKTRSTNTAGAPCRNEWASWKPSQHPVTSQHHDGSRQRNEWV